MSRFTYRYTSRLTTYTAIIVLVALGNVPTALAEAPTLTLPTSLTVLQGSPLHLPLDGFDADGDGLSYSVSISNPDAMEWMVPEGNRSLQLDIADFGVMTFELFEQRAGRATERIISLAEAGFYDGVIFHRVIDNFMIQGGDPTGTGRGGSDLPDFDDHYHEDLRHNVPGVLSMAKAGDDTNNSQFFITDVPTTFLDFNHSVFGLLVEGDDVRNSINGTATDTRDRPLEDVVISSATIIDDIENGVLMLKALEESVNPIDVVVSVTDGLDTVSHTIQVTVGSDTVNHQPFLQDIPVLETMTNTAVTHQLVGVDLEGDGLVYEVARSDLDVVVDANGLLTFNPPADFVGTAQIFVRVREPLNFSDTDEQLITFTVVPEPSGHVALLVGLIAAFAQIGRSRRNVR